MGLRISIPMNPQLKILFLLVIITRIMKCVTVIGPLLPCFIFYLATIKQKICWKTGTLCAENSKWSNSTWPCYWERAAWANSAALRRLHKVAWSSHIDSVCHRCVEKSLQRYMEQSHRRAADTTTSARSLWIVPPNPNDAQRCGELA